MKEVMEYRGGENFDLRQMLLKGKTMRLHDKTAFFSQFLADLIDEGSTMVRVGTAIFGAREPKQAAA